MNIGRVLGTLVVAVGVPALAAVGVAAPRQPMALATVGDSFAAPYDAVWDATLKSLGVVKTTVADKTAGRIETEPFTYTYNIGGAQGSGTQILSVSFQITVIRTAANRTDLQVVPRIHDAFLNGFAPGPTNNPWGDLFARIRQQLGIRG